MSAEKILRVPGGEDDDAALRDRLERFELDDPQASLTFSRRLARENGWSHPFALRVIEEYKRFVFLAMTAGHEVTPSDEVDQAWHLHLTYTRSYWDELCAEVLRRPLHHGPTKGGEREAVRFEDQYEQTLDSYRQAFGEEPPRDIWPPADTRFGGAPYFVRVNTRLGRRKPVMLAGLATVGATTFALPAAQVEIPFLFFAIVFGAAFGLILWAIIKSRGGPGSVSGGGCGGFFSGCGGDSGCGGGGCGGGGCGGCGG